MIFCILKRGNEMKLLIYLLIILLTNSTLLSNNSANVPEADASLMSYAEYDFDLDGTMEMVIAWVGMGIVNYKIYTQSEKGMILIGTITTNNDGEIRKYYDPQEECFFFLSEYVLWKDNWFYYDAVRLEFKEEQMKKTVISSVSGIASEDHQLYIVRDFFDGKSGETYLKKDEEYTSFIERTAEYQKQYEEVYAVNLSQLPLVTKSFTNILEPELSEDNTIMCMGEEISVDCIEASVYFEEGDCMEDLERLVSCKNLSYLYLTNMTSTPLNVSALCQCTSLKSMWIPYNVDISSLSQLNNIEVLLGNITDEYSQSLATMDHLKFIMLDADSKEEDYFKFLSDCTRLEAVYLTENVSEEQKAYIINTFPEVEVFTYY